MRNRRKIWMFAPLGLALFALFGWVLMALWNWLMPELFGLRTIGYWQAWGIFLLGKLIFGGFHGRGGGHWKHRMMERCERMTPEEREKFRQELDRRFGHVSPPDPAPSA